MELFKREVQHSFSPYADEGARELLEKGISECTITKCTEKQICCNWENDIFREVYKAYWRKTLFNIQRNPALLQTFAERLQEVPALPHDTLDPARWEKIKNQKQMKEEHSVSKCLIPTTSMFYCKKCGSNKCSHTQMQIRSADEPMTTFIVCLNCDNRWRFN